LAILNNQKLLALWAADCAQHVLKYFEKEHKDNRPRNAIKAAGDWAKGKIRCEEARKAALAAHAAARRAGHFTASQFAARAAGHAAATAHVAQHAFGAAYYALKVFTAADSANLIKMAIKIAKEQSWQLQRLPKNLKPKWRDWQSRRLPKRLRPIMKI